MACDRCLCGPERPPVSPSPSWPQSSDRAPAATAVPSCWAHASLVQEADRRAAPRRALSRAPMRSPAATANATIPTTPHIAVKRRRAPIVDAEPHERSRGPPQSASTQPIRASRAHPTTTKSPRCNGSSSKDLLNQTAIESENENRGWTQRSFNGRFKAYRRTLPEIKRPCRATPRGEARRGTRRPACQRRR
jgi:hypothetical protein